MRFTVALDGPAAAGKGTIAKAIAARFGFAHLDTGLLYRGVGLRVLAGKDPVAAAIALQPADLSDEHLLRTADVAQAASRVAVVPEVRQVLLKFQQDFAAQEGGAVLDGRDIATVVCPEAAVKIFVTASAEVRAERRYHELKQKDSSVTPEQVLADVMARDARDGERETAPMRVGEGAILLDTSDLSIEDAIAQAIAVVEAALIAPKP